MTADCIWSAMFDDEEREALYSGLVYTGVLGVIFNSWISMAILMSNLRMDRSYMNLANFTMAQYVRRMTWLATRLLFYFDFEALKYSLDFLAFIDTFLDVLEIETLTHVCIERYVVTKYIKNGWNVQKEQYRLFLYLSLLFSALYSIPPLFGLGRFGYDFTCDTFTYDMVLPDNWQGILMTTIFFLRSIKPVIFMALMLVMAHLREDLRNSSEENMKQMEFTQSVRALAVINVLCLTPIFLVRAYVVAYQFYTTDIVQPSTLYVKWAMWIHWFTPVVTTLTLFVMDKNLASHMMDHNTFIFAEEKKQTGTIEKKDI